MEKKVQSLTKVCSSREFFSVFLKQCKSQDPDIGPRTMRVRKRVLATDTAGDQCGTSGCIWAIPDTFYFSRDWKAHRFYFNLGQGFNLMFLFFNIGIISVIN